MATDMDIDMDIDVGLVEDMVPVPEMADIEILPDQPEAAQNGTSAPNDTSGTDSLQPAPEKVHLRGLDNLTTKDVRDFANEHFDRKIERIEWIDDSSLNLVYASSEVAADALRAFSAQEIIDISQLANLQTIPAKPFPSKPQINLQVRIAVVGDRKQAGARERSRFYLFNPEHDPAERRKREGGRRYRDRDDGGYRSQRYDDREQQNRQQGDAEAGFDASLYDDDEAALASRASRNHPRSGSTSSGSDFRGGDRRRQRDPPSGPRELFPERTGGRGGSGRLRDRSASPMRDDDRSRNGPRRRDGAAVENRQSAQAIKTRLREESATKELFPHKMGTSHRGSKAFDAADETADLFAHKMHVPLLDGSSDVRPQSLASRITGNSLASRMTSGSESPKSQGFNIRGTAKTAPAPAVQGFSIKGMASDSPAVKELFPSRVAGGNAGKELFAGRLEGRGGRRQKAEDLFH
ncbi:nucleotide-binding alpha-beta plait protein [Rutstroemia sp. NJR-2017a WRK4]|nr:nucleotide-binding alpha-beta plait protein [Rutstroemia sp. NJR-2017a WRK4]